MTHDDGFRKDYAFSFLAVGCWIAAAAMCFAAVWIDWRWLLTGLLTSFVGFAFGALSMYLDKRYKQMGLRK